VFAPVESGEPFPPFPPDAQFVVAVAHVRAVPPVVTDEELPSPPSEVVVAPTVPPAPTRTVRLLEKEVPPLLSSMYTAPPPPPPAPYPLPPAPPPPTISN
jgi:hypothetical protein